MDVNLTASASVEINASSEGVWDALTNPEKIKLYLFDTEALSDWKIASKIIFKGEYKGQKYRDKGNVLESVENRYLKYNYWSAFSGLEDKLDNYSIVIYEIEKLSDSKVTFTWTQKGFANEEGQCHTQEGLKAMLNQIKEIAEK